MRNIFVKSKMFLSTFLYLCVKPWSLHVQTPTLFPAAGPFCTGRGGATKETGACGGVDPDWTVAMGTNILFSSWA